MLFKTNTSSTPQEQTAYRDNFLFRPHHELEIKDRMNIPSSGEREQHSSRKYSSSPKLLREKLDYLCAYGCPLPRSLCTLAVCLDIYVDVHFCSQWRSMMRLMFALFALLTVTDAMVLAGPPRRYRQRQSAPMVMESMPAQQPQVTTVQYVDPSSPVTSTTTTSAPTTATATGSDDALNEVNAARAQRGLKPFLPDPLLNQAAQACAKQRCARHIDGHLPESDFKYLPAGASASAAGCGALEPSWGWGTCCTYENYTYAGAAWVMGTDGKRYMHLFVR
jgi:hypothetical protein